MYNCPVTLGEAASRSVTHFYFYKKNTPYMNIESARNKTIWIFKGISAQMSCSESEDETIFF